MAENAEINVQMEGDNKMVKEKQEVVHKARRQLKVIESLLIAFSF